VFGSAEMTSTARTQQATHAIELSGKDLLSLCQEEPAFGYQLMTAVARTLARRLTASRLQLIDVYRRDSGRKSTSQG
jgi:CRP-like cAMP-binding protein